MDILHDVMDQKIMDRDKVRCGRVDDIEIEDGFDRPPRVVALISGGGTKSRLIWRPLHRFSLWIHRLLEGTSDIRPARVPWELVEKLEADVYLKVTGQEAGLGRLNDAVGRRIIGRIPGANK